MRTPVRFGSSSRMANASAQSVADSCHPVTGIPADALHCQRPRGAAQWRPMTARSRCPTTSAVGGLGLRSPPRSSPSRSARSPAASSGSDWFFNADNVADSLPAGAAVPRRRRRHRSGETDGLPGGAWLAAGAWLLAHQWRARGRRRASRSASWTNGDVAGMRSRNRGASRALMAGGVAEVARVRGAGHRRLARAHRWSGSAFASRPSVIVAHRRSRVAAAGPFAAIGVSRSLRG